MSLEVQTKPQVLPPAESPIPPSVSGGDKLTIMELWRVLTKQRLVILSVTILSLAGALWYALRTPSIYESMARIEIRPQESANIGIDQLIAQKEEGQAQNDLQTEVAMYIETLQAVQQYDSNHDQNAEGQHLCGDDGPEDVPSPDDK